MFFTSDAERASAQAGKASRLAGAAGGQSATGARNLGAAVVAALAEVTAPTDDSSHKHARKAKSQALKAADRNRVAAAKAARKAGKHSGKAADRGRAAAVEGGDTVAGHVATLADQARQAATDAAHGAAGRAVGAAETVRAKAGPAGETVKEKAGVGAALVAALAAAARAKAQETRDRAVVGVDHGIDAAVPRAQEGVAAVAPRVDHLRDVINDELLPKIQAMLGDVQTGKDRVLAKDEGVVAALTGAPKAGQNKKGGALLTLGVLAAAGAGLAWWLSQQQKAPADPWATTTATTTDLDPWAPAPAPATGTTVTDTATTGTTPVASGDVAGEVRMLESDEIDELAVEEPLPVEEQQPAEQVSGVGSDRVDNGFRDDREGDAPRV